FFSKISGDRSTQVPVRRRGGESVIPGPLVFRSALAHENKPAAVATGRWRVGARLSPSSRVVCRPWPNNDRLPPRPEWKVPARRRQLLLLHEQRHRWWLAVFCYADHTTQQERHDAAGKYVSSAPHPALMPLQADQE